MSRSSPSPGGDDLASPASPIYAPTHSRLVPRHERRVTTSSIKFPLSAPPPTATHYYARSSVYSLSSGPGTSTITFASHKASSINSGTATVAGTSTPPLSPTRPPRPHDGPLEIPDLVKPAGPPPNRALPPPPPNHPNSPTFSVSPVSPLSPTFSPRPLALGGGSSPAISAVAIPPPGRHDHDSINSNNTTNTKSRHHHSHHQHHQHHHDPAAIGIALSASTSTKELCDLTESYARETRESWGSWSGAGGGGPGTNPAAPKRGSNSPRGSADRKGGGGGGGGGGSSVALQELDLEKLGGRY
ncbi:Uu.00g077260.m01.CDS01 [Anthostomella pinea]|uniref:Uu.00g077260.m01.CDS01 n=1 Tax=Anthostomella pinea TaxID=933095 RepID=A0AAI8VQB9_9PEZI|nr:Uu.00g077260.m01.CDS01 [Anthostomella pinea]